MRTRTRWIVAGGAAAFVLTPIASVYGSTALDTELEQRGVVVGGEAARVARPANTPGADPSAAPSGRPSDPTLSKRPAATEQPAAKKSSTQKPEPSGKKTVSAASPVSPRTAMSPDTPG